MKKYFGFLILPFVLLVFTTSCDKGSDSLLDIAPESENAFLSASMDSVVTEYPAAIDDYVAANHPEATISEVVLEDDGTYEVTLDDGTELYFDAEGNHFEEMEDDGEEEDSHEDCDDEYEDDDEEEDSDEMDEYVTDYPSAIDDYVAANHPNATNVKVELEDDGTYEVELDDDTEIVFDADGNFVEYDD
jgi:hypothetical protein